MSSLVPPARAVLPSHPTYQYSQPGQTQTNVHASHYQFQSEPKYHSVSEYRSQTWGQEHEQARYAYEYRRASYCDTQSSSPYVWQDNAPVASTSAAASYTHAHTRGPLLASPSPSPSPVQVKVEAETDEEMGDGEDVYGGSYGFVREHVPSEEDVDVDVESASAGDEDKENMRLDAEPYTYAYNEYQQSQLPSYEYDHDEQSQSSDEERKEEKELTEWVTAASPRRSSHFLAEKTCEMVCYLWFSASLGPSARKRRRERDRAREEREREREKEKEKGSPWRGRTRELGPQTAHARSPLSSTRPSSSTRPRTSRSTHGHVQPQVPSYSLTTPTTASLQFSASPEFVAFMHRLLATTQVSQSVIVLALHYIYRLKEGNEFSLGRPGSEFRVGVVALMLANKFVDECVFLLFHFPIQ